MPDVAVSASARESEAQCGDDDQTRSGESADAIPRANARRSAGKGKNRVMVTVIAAYRARPGSGDAVAAVLALHVRATRAEPGRIEFSAYRDPSDADCFALFERYVDEDAFQAHRLSLHFANYIEARVVPLLEDRQWRRYVEIPPSDVS